VTLLRLVLTVRFLGCCQSCCGCGVVCCSLQRVLSKEVSEESSVLSPCIEVSLSLLGRRQHGIEFSPSASERGPQGCGILEEGVGVFQVFLFWVVTGVQGSESHSESV
jgi:hypothetical protein